MSGATDTDFQVRINECKSLINSCYEKAAAISSLLTIPNPVDSDTPRPIGNVESSSLSLQPSNQFFYADAPGVVCIPNELNIKLPRFSNTDCSCSNWPSVPPLTSHPFYQWKLRNEVESWLSVPLELSLLAISSLVKIKFVEFQFAANVLVSSTSGFPSRLLRPLSLLLQATVNAAINEVVGIYTAHLQSAHHDQDSKHTLSATSLLQCPVTRSNFMRFHDSLAAAMDMKDVLPVVLQIMRKVIITSLKSVPSERKSTEKAEHFPSCKKFHHESPSDAKPGGHVADLGAVARELSILAQISKQTLPSTPESRAKEYEEIVSVGSRLRTLRKYLEVPDNDGILNFSKRSDKPKMSSTEMAAAERDFRRRRLRYRTSTNKKDPKQVMRNLIHGHMKALTEAANDETGPRMNKEDLRSSRSHGKRDDRKLPVDGSQREQDSHGHVQKRGKHFDRYSSHGLDERE